MPQSGFPEPVFLNLEYIFFLFYKRTAGFFDYLFSEAFWNDIKVIFTIVVILLITVVLYCLVRLWEIKKEAKKKEEVVNPTGVTAENTIAIPHRNDRWESIRTRTLSEDENEWRLAIIEADIYLDQLLRNKGYQGETLSDKLKQVSAGDLPSIQGAWEAHKIRNRIAHDGNDFILTRPEARKTLAYFEVVFRELGAIE